MSLNKEQLSFFEKLQKQFLSGYPLRRMSWQKLQNDIINWNQTESYELQAKLIEFTIQHHLNVEKPLKLTYQYEFLKNLIKILEVKTNEIHDSIYESLTAITQKLQESDEFSYKHFLYLEKAISLKESTYFVTAGTTGLCTWPASIALTEYALQHPELIENNRILELGAGLGFCSLFLFKFCAPKTILVTDGSSVCLQHFAHNLQLNFPKALSSATESFTTDDGRRLAYTPLKWESIDQSTQTINEYLPNLVLASDVIYESSSHHSLIEALKYIVHLTGHRVEFIFSFVIRHPDTVNCFLQALESANFQVIDLQVPESGEHLFWDDSTPIRIISIRSKAFPLI